MAAGNPVRVSLRELARGLGVTHPAVLKAYRAGRLEGALGVGPSGRVEVLDADLAVRLWASNRQEATEARRPEVPRSSGEAPEPAASGEDADVTLMAATIRDKLASARTKELALRVRGGELIELKEAKRQAFAAQRMVRDSLLNVPDRIAAELAGETDEAAVHATLDREIRQALMMATAEVESDAA